MVWDKKLETRGKIVRWRGIVGFEIKVPPQLQPYLNLKTHPRCCPPKKQ